MNYLFFSNEANISSAWSNDGDMLDFKEKEFHLCWCFVFFCSLHFCPSNRSKSFEWAAYVLRAFVLFMHFTNEKSKEISSRMLIFLLILILYADRIAIIPKTKLSLSLSVCYSITVPFQMYMWIRNFSAYITVHNTKSRSYPSPSNNNIIVISRQSSEMLLSARLIRMNKEKTQQQQQQQRQQ